ncbi:hypothetical protein EVAR_49374_1 [Eumeta japonica]|uniref:Uncharacterized protein n=1 Tax=Eumeta variegata TaxID=151549 RepID=A0A4C1XYT3_EUMVA|nr:hypothetical protein EVAR_49374_1 [Eumeta japonica]
MYDNEENKLMEGAVGHRNSPSRDKETEREKEREKIVFHEKKQCFLCHLKGKMSMRATRGYVIFTARGHLHPQRSDEWVVGLLERNRIPDGEGIGHRNSHSRLQRKLLLHV